MMHIRASSSSSSSSYYYYYLPIGATSYSTLSLDLVFLEATLTNTPNIQCSWHSYNTLGGYKRHLNWHNFVPLPFTINWLTSGTMPIDAMITEKSLLRHIIMIEYHLNPPLVSKVINIHSTSSSYHHNHNHSHHHYDHHHTSSVS
jgi:hypothetical protein